MLMLIARATFMHQHVTVNKLRLGLTHWGMNGTRKRQLHSELAPSSHIQYRRRVSVHWLVFALHFEGARQHRVSDSADVARLLLVPIRDHNMNVEAGPAVSIDDKLHARQQNAKRK